MFGLTMTQSDVRLDISSSVSQNANGETQTELTSTGETQ